MFTLRELVLKMNEEMKMKNLENKIEMDWSHSLNKIIKKIQDMKNEQTHKHEWKNTGITIQGIDLKQCYICMETDKLNSTNHQSYAS